MIVAEEAVIDPKVGPKKAGTLKLNLTPGWEDSDALAVTVKNPEGHELWTWVYPLSSPRAAMKF